MHLFFIAKLPVILLLPRWFGGGEESFDQGEVLCIAFAAPGNKSSSFTQATLEVFRTSEAHGRHPY